MSGAAGGAVVGGGGSVAAVIAPADMEFAPAAAGAPVDIPFVKDCARDCGDKGGADAAGVETPGIDGPPTPTAGAPGWRGGGAGPVGRAGDAGSPRGLPIAVVAGMGDVVLRSGSGAPCAPRGPLAARVFGEGGCLPPPGSEVPIAPLGSPITDEGSSDGEFRSSAATRRGGGRASRLTPCSFSQARASPPMVTSSMRCVASMILDIAVAPALEALAFFSAMTAFTAATLASISPGPDRIWSISLLPEWAMSRNLSRKLFTASVTRSLWRLLTSHCSATVARRCAPRQWRSIRSSAVRPRFTANRDRSFWRSRASLCFICPAWRQ